MDVHHNIHLQTVSGQDFVERLGLDRRTGEPVEDTPAGILVLGDVIPDHADDDLVGSQLAFADVLFHAASELRAAPDLVADHLAGRNMVDSVVLFQALGLGALAASRSAE